MVLQDISSVSEDAGVHSITGESHVPKIRKPYTITKQRERWTEEEHNKFLEALKLYGRAWRKIEEHVGSKTAVQIRSHAQKFFSKVARETSNINSSTVEPIEIPPPRPKRKPMHPYPRKLALNAGKESQIEQRVRSTSPHSSVSDQDNRSPTSVLSAVISDTPASGDATTPDGSPPPISSDDMHKEAEDNFPQDEGHLTQSVADPVSVKLELFPDICVADEEECAGGKVFKLFGKNIVVPSNPSNSLTHRSASPFPDVGEGMIEMSTENRPVDIEMTNFDNFHNRFDGRDKSMMDVNAIQVEKPIPLPWWVLYRGSTSIPPFGCQSGEGLDKETQVEESCAGSNSGSVNGEANVDMNWDSETQSGRYAPQCGKDNKSFDKINPSLIERKISSDKIGKGFVPYKRCFSDKDMQSSTITSDDREGQRIRLCL